MLAEAVPSGVARNGEGGFLDYKGAKRSAKNFMAKPTSETHPLEFVVEMICSIWPSGSGV